MANGQAGILGLETIFGSKDTDLVADRVALPFFGKPFGNPSHRVLGRVAKQLSEFVMRTSI